MIKITIKFKYNSNSGWQTITLSPEEYFEPISEDEEYELDSVPLYLDVIDYLDIDDINKVKTICLEQVNTEDNSIRTVKTHYWNNQDNFVREVYCCTSNEEYFEVITQSLIDVSPLVYEIMRIVKIDDILQPTYHGFITKNEDGSETEKVIQLD